MSDTANRSKSRIFLFGGGILAIFATVILLVAHYEANRSMPVSQMVAKNGTPTFLAKGLDVDNTDLRVLRILVLPQDPQTVTNWNSITNTILVWAEAESARRNARYFYNDMKSDKSFYGSAWYSRRGLFRGEKMIIAKTDSAGNASGQRTFRIDAISMRLMGFIPRKSPLDELK